MRTEDGNGRNSALQTHSLNRNPGNRVKIGSLEKSAKFQIPANMQRGILDGNRLVRQKKREPIFSVPTLQISVPGGIRTHDLPLRSTLPLYSFKLCSVHLSSGFPVKSIKNEGSESLGGRLSSSEFVRKAGLILDDFQIYLKKICAAFSSTRLFQPPLYFLNLIPDYQKG